MARILLVNDEKDLVEVCGMVLEGQGHEVIALTDGAKAFDVAVRQPPDIIILDWVLGNMTGEDLLRALRAHPATRRTPILMISALPDLEARAAVLGADGALGKPFDEDQLIRAVEELDPTRRQQSAEGP
jgi:DNA-binding response OmpR family regulator